MTYNSSDFSKVSHGSQYQTPCRPTLLIAFNQHEKSFRITWPKPYFLQNLLPGEFSSPLNVSEGVM